MAVLTQNHFFMTYDSAREINRELNRVEGMTLDLLSKYDDYRTRKLQLSRTGRSSSKDSQRSKVYESEWAFRSQYVPKTFKDAKEARNYVNRILRSKLWSQVDEAGKEVTLLVNENRAIRTYAGRAHWDGTLELSIHGMDEYTVLHELAHLAGHMHHDVGFCQTLLKLVSRFMGREPAKILRSEMKSRRVKIALNTNIKEPADWLRDYQRMQKVRSMVGR